METEGVIASTMIEAASEVVFAVLADPSAHAAIDGPGGVRESLHGDRITAVGQVCRMAMDHENHPDKNYEIASRVEVFDEPRAIAWQRGTESPETGELSFGGWIWRYALEASGPSRTPGRSSRLGQSGGDTRRIVGCTGLDLGSDELEQFPVHRPIEALTSEAFRASANVLFGFSGTEKQARTTPGWLRPEVEDDLFAFIQSVASAYAEAVAGDPLQ